MSPTASVPRSWGDASVPLRAVTWPNSTQDHNGLLLCDTATYINGCSTSASCHFHDFGGNNRKYADPPLVTVEYLDTERTFRPEDFPAPPPVAPPPSSAGRRLGRTFSATADRKERSRSYLSKVPPAIAGQHGDVHTFRTCCRIVRGFGLDDDDALDVLADWNARCQPLWTEAELRDKIRRARTYGCEPIDGML